MIRQCAILFGCLALGELIVYLTGIKLPSSIIGMLLLTLFLKLGWIKLHWVQGLSDFLVANLGFFFVPPGVALMLYFDVIAAEFWPIVTATIVSTALVLVVTGWVHQIVRVQPGYHADLACLLVTDYQHVLFVFFLCHLKNVLMGYL